MSDRPIYLYEGLFLLNQQAVASDYAGCVDFIKGVFERAEAELLSLRKWDERRLAYPIKGQKRGTYILTYFRARGTQIANIERDCNLSDQVMRNMMLRAEHIGETELEISCQEDQRVEQDMKLCVEQQASDHPSDNASRPSTAQAIAVQVPLESTQTTDKTVQTVQGDAAENMRKPSGE